MRISIFQDNSFYKFYAVFLMIMTEANVIYHGDCYTALKRAFPSGTAEEGIDLIYLDPPFSFDPKYAKIWYDKETFKMFREMTRGRVKYFVGWLSKRLEQCHRVLKKSGSLYLHCDWKFGHYLKIELDNIFGRKNFQNEIIWSYKSGGASSKRFSRKHDNIFFYTKSNDYIFNPQKEKSYNRDLKPYRFKGVEEFEDERGWYTLINMRDVWEIDMVGRTSGERIGYATQKPLGLLKRIILASSNEGDLVLDPMCGCGTTLAAAHELNRRWVGIDVSSQACQVIQKRMTKLEGIEDVEIRGLPLTITNLLELNPFEFQDFICEMTNSEKTPHVRDKGIDGYLRGELPLQIKQQEGVGRPVVDSFQTALKRRHKNCGFIIGFSFSKEAYEEKARAKEDGLRIELVEIRDLLKNDYNLENILAEE